MRYRLRTLLIVLALGPPVLAAMWFVFRDLTWVEGAYTVAIVLVSAATVAAVVWRFVHVEY